MSETIKLFTAQEVAEVLRLSRLSVYRQLDRGDLRAIRLGEHGPLRIEEGELRRYLDEGGDRGG